MYLLNGTPINLDRDLVIGEGDAAITYPAAALRNLVLRTDLGITEVPDPVRPDERYYWVAENPDGSLTATLKDPTAWRHAFISRVESWRDTACYADVVAMGHTWQADERSRGLLGEAILMAQAGLPLPPVWRDVDNVDMPITAITDLLAIAGAMGAQVQAAYTRSWELKALINAATTPEACEALVW